MKAVALIIAGSLIFGGGFCFGAVAHNNIVKKRILKLQPILATSLSDFVTKAMKENMTREQMQTYLGEELEFIKIVMD